MSTNKRVYFIDWLRIIAVALLIPHHAAITFSYIGDTYVYAPVRDMSPYFFIQSYLFNIWFMRLLFLVSGFSSWHSLQRRSDSGFLLERITKVIIPLVVGICVICPPMAFLRARQSYGFTGNLLSFYPEFFRSFASGKYLGWGHLWFLAYLFVYSVILVFFRIAEKRCSAFIKQIVRIVTKNPVVPLLYCIVVEMIFRPFFPGKQNLYADWANVLLYGFFFYYGYLIAENPELLDRITSDIRKLAVIAPCAFISFLILNAVKLYSVLPDVTSSYPYVLLEAFFRGTAEYTWVMLILGFARNHMNTDGKIRRYLSSSSFALYLFHYVLLSYVMYALLGTKWNNGLVFVMGIVITYALFFVCYELIIRRIPVLRALCGIKQAG
jgi:glucans biosynthesis protein C